MRYARLVAVTSGRSEDTTVALPSSFTSIVGFGDSMTAGSNATTAANRWLNILATAKSAGTPLNKGISATVLQNSNDGLGAPRTDNGRDRFVADVLGANKRHVIAMAYGYNDARWTGLGTGVGDINAANFLIDLREVMIGLCFGGYDPSQIILFTPAYITDTGLVSGSADFNGQTRVGFEAFVTHAVNVGTEFGCYFANQYTGMLAAGGGALIDTDNIHPTDAGHAAMAVIGQAARMQATGRVANIVTTASSPTELTVTWDAVSGATGYDVEIFLRGGFIATVSSTSATNSKVFSGLGAGEYVARVRVNGPAVKPWGFQIFPTLVGTTQALLDTFTGTGLITAHTADSTHTWALQVPGTPPTANAILTGAGQVRSNQSASRAHYQSSITPADADYSVHAYITQVGAGQADQIGVCGRMAASGTDTYYFARYIESAGTSAFALFRRVASTNTQIGSTYTRQLSIGETVKLSLTMVGTTITMLVDDVSRATGTDANITATGKPGFYTAGATTTDTNGIHIQNLWMVN